MAWFAVGILATVALTVGVVFLYFVVDPAPARLDFGPQVYEPPPLWATLAILLGGWGPAVVFWVGERRALAAGLAVGATGLTWIAYFGSK